MASYLRTSNANLGGPYGPSRESEALVGKERVIADVRAGNEKAYNLSNKLAAVYKEQGKNALQIDTLRLLINLDPDNTQSPDSQSSIIEQTTLVGPSMKACSSAVSVSGRMMRAEAGLLVLLVEVAESLGGA